MASTIVHIANFFDSAFSILLSIPLQPYVTGPLLFLVTRGPVDLRQRITSWIAAQRNAPSVSTVTTSLKVLFGIGVVRYANTLLTRWAFNGWRLNTGGREHDWPKEVAVITGGSSGIGAEVVKNLVGKGVTVAILDVQPPPSGLNGNSKVHYYKTNIASVESVNESAAKIRSDLGTPSVLVNNAGVISWDTILNAKPEILERMFKVNVISHWYTVQAFLPGMIESKKGHIVTTASMASYVAVSGLVDYCASKAAVLAFHEGLNQELRHRYDAPFIKTTSVHPNYVKTGMIAHFEEKAAPPTALTPEFVAGEVTKAIFSGRSGQVMLPKSISFISGIRGWAGWIQEFIRDTQSQAGKD